MQFTDKKGTTKTLEVGFTFKYQTAMKEVHEVKVTSISNNHVEVFDSFYEVSGFKTIKNLVNNFKDGGYFF